MDIFNKEQNINKYLYGVVSVDLNKDKLPKVAREFVKNRFPEIDVTTLSVNVKSFNLV